MYGEDAAIEVKEVPMDVDFGTRDDDKMPHSWACRGLTWLHSERGNVFADMMLHVVGVEKKQRGGK